MKAQDALQQITAGHLALLDVRSEGEYQDGHLPGFSNAPILSNDERHLVGLTYKKQGQEAAIALGHELVAPHKAQRIQSWLTAIEQSRMGSGLVICWRGGLRSQIATSWIKEHRSSVERVEGGYKAIRALLLQQIATPPPLLMLSGMTGSGKTQLIHNLDVCKIDLEDLAKHRGSSFGRLHHTEQPSQATFENLLGLAIGQTQNQETLVEDESSSIGRVMLPASFRLAMKEAPVVILRATREERSQAIFREYVLAPLHGSDDGLLESLTSSVRAIARRLGGALAQEIEGQIRTALYGKDPLEFQSHEPWITTLLAQYYDQAYQHAFDRQQRKIAFEGNYQECRQWISQKLNSQKPSPKVVVPPNFQPASSGPSSPS